MIFAPILPVTSSAFTLSKMIALKAFIENKNLILGTPSLATGCQVIIDNAQIMRIHKYAFVS